MMRGIVLGVLIIILYVHSVYDEDFFVSYPLPPSNACENKENYYGQLNLSGDEISIIPPQQTEINTLNLIFNKPYFDNFVFEFIIYNRCVPEKENAIRYFGISPPYRIKKGSSLDINSPTNVTIFQLFGNEWHPLTTTKISNQTYRARIEHLGVFAAVKKDVEPVGIWQDINEKGFVVWITEFDYVGYNSLKEITSTIERRL